MEIAVLNSGKISKENTPIPRKITRGNSTIVWPMAIFTPDLMPSFRPKTTFAANNGPGVITPDAEIIITDTTKSITWFILSVISELDYEINLLISYLYIESLRCLDSSSVSLIKVSAFSASFCNRDKSQDVPGISLDIASQSFAPDLKSGPVPSE